MPASRLLLLFVLAAIVGCSVRPPTKIDSLTSPTGQYEATLLNYSPGGTLESYVWLTVTPKGVQPSSRHVRVTMPYCRNLQVAWTSSTVLRVSYSDIFVGRYSKFAVNEVSPISITLAETPNGQQANSSAKAMGIDDCSASLGNPGAFAIMRANATKVGTPIGRSR